MYFIYVSSDIVSIDCLEEILFGLEHKKFLLSVNDGFDLIQFLEGVKAGEAYPDLIIFPMEMARLNGRELLELLKSDDMYCLIPVIMFLSEKEMEEEMHFRKLGAETIPTPLIHFDWINAAQKMCTMCN